MEKKFNGLPGWAVWAAWSVMFRTGSVSETFELKHIEYAPNNIRATWSAMREARIELQHVHARQIALLTCSGYVADYMRDLARWTALEKPKETEAAYIKIGREFRERGVDPRAHAEHNYKQLLYHLAKSGVATINGEPVDGKEELRARAVTASYDEARYDRYGECLSDDEQSLAKLLKRVEAPASEKEKREQQEHAEVDGLMSWLDEKPGKTTSIKEPPGISRLVVIHAAPTTSASKTGASDEETRHKMRGALSRKMQIGPALDRHRIDEIYAELFSEAPWHAQVIEWLWCRHLETLDDSERCAWLPPSLIVGPPGCGKTFLMTRLAELLELPAVRMDMTGSLEPWSIAGGGFWLA